MYHFRLIWGGRPWPGSVFCAASDEGGEGYGTILICLVRIRNSGGLGCMEKDALKVDANLAIDMHAPAENWGSWAEL